MHISTESRKPEIFYKVSLLSHKSCYSFTFQSVFVRKPCCVLYRHSKALAEVCVWNEWQWRRDNLWRSLHSSKLINEPRLYLLATLLSDLLTGVQKIPFCHKNALQSGQTPTRNSGFLYMFGPLLSNLRTIFNCRSCKQYCETLCKVMFL